MTPESLWWVSHQYINFISGFQATEILLLVREECVKVKFIQLYKFVFFKWLLTLKNNFLPILYKKGSFI